MTTAQTLSERNHATYEIDEVGPIRIEAWPDPVIDQVGHDPRGEYTEHFWLPVLGPTCVLLLRRFAEGLEQRPEGFAVDLVEASRSLGLGPKVTRHGSLLRSIDRCCNFGMARLAAGDHLQVRRQLPPITRRQLSRLPDSLRARHDDVLADQQARSAQGMQRRARALALSMLTLGESYEDAERQLHRWRFHPAIAHEALRWALEQPAPAPTSAPAG